MEQGSWKADGLSVHRNLTPHSASNECIYPALTTLKLIRSRSLEINSSTAPYGDIHLARMRFHQEFSLALENTQNRGGLESAVLDLIQSLGFSGYAVMGLDFDRLKDRINPPNRYLTSYSHNVYRGCAAQLHCALRQTSNIQLSSLYHWVENIGSNPDGSNIGWSCYVLNTGTGNYGYLIPGDTYSKNHKVALSVMSEELKPDEFRDHMERTQLALAVLAKKIEERGQKICPELFLEGRDIDPTANINIAGRPLQILQAIAAEDLTLNQAAEKLGIARDTANKHIAAAKSALGAATTVGAVLRAVEEGFIEV